ncbi:MAG: NfeD family protein [Acidobacteriota bacterium]
MLKVPVSLLLGALAAGGMILIFLIRLVLRTQLRGVVTSPMRMVGLKGKAVTEVKAEGRVMVQGEYWWAHAWARIGAGESVRVVGIDGMMLEVEPCPDKSITPRQVSAIAPPDAELQ